MKSLNQVPVGGAGGKWASLIVATLAGVVVLLVIDRMIRQHEREDALFDLNLRASRAAHEVHTILDAHMSAIRDLAAVFVINDGQLDRRVFDRLAREMIVHRPSVSCLQWVDSDYRIRYIYPLQGNEKALGLDLKKNANAYPFSRRVFEERLLTVAPPIMTAQGRLCIILRAPVVVDDVVVGSTQCLMEMSDMEQALSRHFGADGLYRLESDLGEEVISRDQEGEGIVVLPLRAGADSWVVHAWLGQPQVFSAKRTMLWATGGALLVCSLLLINVSWRRGEWLQVNVEERTRELAARNEELGQALTRISALSTYQACLLDTPDVWISVSTLKGEITSWNRGAEIISGYSLEDVQKHDSFWPVLVPDRRTFVGARRQVLEQLRDEGLGLDFEVDIIDRDGDQHSLIWYCSKVDVQSGEAEQFMLVGIDITPRKLALNALQSSEARFRSTFELADIGLAHVAMSGCLLRVNNHVSTMLEYAPVALLKLQLEDVVERGDLASFSPAMKEVAEKSRDSYREEIRLTSKSGRQIWADVTVSMLFNPNGTAGYFILSIQDITKRKLQQLELLEVRSKLQSAVEELRTTQANIVRQERLRALGTMASGIAHDFNNNLAVISGFGELLDMRIGDHPDERVRSYLDRIRKATENAAMTVGRMREFYRERNDSDVLASVDLNRLVEEAVSLTEPRWRRQAQGGGHEILIEQELSPVPETMGHPSELRDMLANLIINAVDAMPTGGTMTLKTEAKGGKVVLSVSDTGAGMDEHTVRQCMEPFFTTKGQQGTGLGLAMVHGIINRHEGEISISSTVGKGTVFRLTLPVVRAEGELNAQEVVVPACLGLKVLVVDDELRIRELLESLLAIDEHEVTLAEDGAEALIQYKQRSYDLVITDRAMPVVGGDELARQIRAINARMPVIMVTGFGDIMAEKGEVPDGVTLVISKPVKLDDLRQAINTAMMS